MQNNQENPCQLFHNNCFLSTLKKTYPWPNIKGNMWGLSILFALIALFAST